MTRLTVLCTTSGRKTLADTLRSLVRQQWLDGDQTILVNDGPPSDFVTRNWCESGLTGKLINLPNGPSNDWGHTPRNRVLPSIQNGHIIHLDDDDMLAPYALNTIRAVIQKHPKAFLFFRMTYPDGSLVWKTEEIKEGNIGTGTFVHPSEIEFGRFGNRHMGDFDFIIETISLNTNRDVIWRKEATYLVEPQTKSVNPVFVDLQFREGATGREDCQSGWQLFFGEWFRHSNILDVGSGLGLAKSRLAIGQNKITTQDKGPNLPVDLRCDLSEIPDKSFDVVTCFDVIEHIPDDCLFVHQLVRIAREAVVITTPNVWVWHCANPHHIREYSPPSLMNLFEGIDDIRSLQPFGSLSHNGADPTPFSHTEFLATEHPVIALIVRLK